MFNSFLKVAGLATLLAWLLLAPLLHVFATPDALRWAAAGCSLAALCLIYEFYTLSRVGQQDLRPFMQAFLGGMVVRLLVVGAVLFLLIKFTDVNLTSFVFSLFGFYVLYLVIEMYFVVKGSRQRA
jgi:hypothetical protein